MARSTIKKNKITKDGWEIIGNNLLEFFQQIHEEKGISINEIYMIFQESLSRGLIKQLDGGNGPEPTIQVEFDHEKNAIRLTNLKEIVEVCEDDFLQVQLNEIIDEYPGAVVGEFIREPYFLSEFGSPAIGALMQSFNQKIIESEKRILFEIYKDKVETIITGIVDRIDGNNVFVNIGKTTVRLARKDLIGGETFETGESIKVYIDKVSATTKGAQIEVSRSHPGFLRKLFEEEIPEIYEKSVLIKSDEPINNIYGVVREAGTRAKVAVYTNNPNIDPVSSCIGQNGSRIQKIVASLGRGRNRENVDVILYSKNPILFVADSLKPAHISGVILNDIHHTATVIVPDDQVSVSIGVRGSNIRLAQKMTGYIIKVLSETEAVEQGISYTPVNDIEVEDRREKELSKQVEIREKRRQLEERMSNLQDNTSIEIDDKYVDEQEVSPTVAVTDLIVEELVEEALDNPSVDEIVVETPKETVVVTRTTVTLEDLEKSIEADKNKKPIEPRAKRVFTKPVPRKVEKPIETPVEESKNYKKMDIYSEDELKELEGVEDEINEDVELDLEDFEDYYDEE